MVLINANDEAQTFDSALDGRQLMLHPVQQASVDPVVKTATYDAGNGKFTVPARTTAVWVEKQLAADALVTFPGSYPEAAGLGGNWAPDNQNIKASDANNDSVWKFVTDKIPAGNYEFKAAVGGSWSENYGVNGAPGGDNVKFTATTGQPVAFYYDRSDNYVTSRPGAIIPAAVGSFASEIGGADWSPDNLTTWMKDKDGDGVYTFATAVDPARQLRVQGGAERRLGRGLPGQQPGVGRARARRNGHLQLQQGRPKRSRPTSCRSPKCRRPRRRRVRS